MSNRMEPRSKLRRVFNNIRTPVCFGGERFYDNLLKKVKIYGDQDGIHDNRIDGLYELKDINVSQVWPVFGQTYIDDFINNNKRKQWCSLGKWMATPSLDPTEFPMFPGSVILVDTSGIWPSKRKGYIAGSIPDFYPSCQDVHKGQPITTTTNDVDFGEGLRVYKARSNNKVVLINAEAGDIYEISDTFNKDDTFIDLDNFDFTNFDGSFCYVVTKVIHSRRLTLEMSHDRLVYYQVVYEPPVPICFQVSKVRLAPRGVIGVITPVKGKLPFQMKGKRSEENFFGAFVPNQAQQGNAVGDHVITGIWSEPHVSQYLRLDYLQALEQKLNMFSIRFVSPEIYKLLVQWLDEMQEESAERVKERKRQEKEDKAATRKRNRPVVRLLLRRLVRCFGREAFQSDRSTKGKPTTEDVGGFSDNSEQEQGPSYTTSNIQVVEMMHAEIGDSEQEQVYSATTGNVENAYESDSLDSVKSERAKSGNNRILISGASTTYNVHGVQSDADTCRQGSAGETSDQPTANANQNTDHHEESSQRRLSLDASSILPGASTSRRGLKSRRSKALDLNNRPGKSA